MDYEVVKKIHINKNSCKKAGEFYYCEEIDGLFFDGPWPFPVQLLVYENLSKCKVTPGFVKLPFILKGWINLDILLREIELLKLVLVGKILMHGSCVDNTLIVGLPNSGKTYHTYSLVSKKGTLISEEYTVLDGTLAQPYKPIMRTCFSERTLKDCRINISFAEKVALFFSTIRAKLMPFMFEAVIWKKIPASGKSSRINKIVYGSTGREVKTWKEFAILCENEFPFMASEFLQAYAIATGFDLIGHQEKQRNLIKEFVDAVYPSA